MKYIFIRRFRIVNHLDSFSLFKKKSQLPFFLMRTEKLINVNVRVGGKEFFYVVLNSLHSFA